MDFQAILDRYGLWAAVLLLMLTNVLPKLVEAVKWAIEKMAPERMAKMKMIADENERQDKILLEREQFDRDLRERDVIAKEQTAKALLLIDSHMQSADRNIHDQLQLVTTGLITANQSLAVLLDRQRVEQAQAAK
jgi:hypothetical protein